MAADIGTLGEFTLFIGAEPLVIVLVSVSNHLNKNFCWVRIVKVYGPINPDETSPLPVVGRRFVVGYHNLRILSDVELLLRGVYE